MIVDQLLWEEELDHKGETRVFKRNNKVKAPSLLLVAMEGRAIFEYGAMIASSALLKKSPLGDGHPVLVLPGLSATDFTTRPLRSFLKTRGYQTFGWGLGRNLGMRDGILDGMISRLESIYNLNGKPVSLVGWSLGGIFARELAKLRPEMVRGVISLGSPHSGHPKSTNAWRFYEFASGKAADAPVLDTLLYKAPPVPTTSIYSKSDGVVAWQTCHQTQPICPKKARQTENIIIEGSHCGLGVNPAALFAIADRLSQPIGGWLPFRSSGSRRLFFKTPGLGTEAFG